MITAVTVNGRVDCRGEARGWGGTGNFTVMLFKYFSLFSHKLSQCISFSKFNLKQVKNAWGTLNSFQCVTPHRKRGNAEECMYLKLSSRETWGPVTRKRWGLWWALRIPLLLYSALIRRAQEGPTLLTWTRGGAAAHAVHPPASGLQPPTPRTAPRGLLHNTGTPRVTVQTVNSS